MYHAFLDNGKISLQYVLMSRQYKAYLIKIKNLTAFAEKLIARC